MVVATANMDKPESMPLLGVRVDRLDMDGAMGAIRRFIAEGGTHHVVTLDSSMCVMAQTDPELMGIVRDADLVTPDSAGVLWACRHLRRPMPERVSGVEIVERICALSAEIGCRIFFLGAAPGIANLAADRMCEKYPGCRIVGVRDGYFKEADEPRLIREIRESTADVLFVALGIPKQEKWIHRHASELGVSVLVGVGGSFDVHSGTVKRAPYWVQRLNLEWLYRLARNPRKIGKVMTLPRFVLLALRKPAKPI